MILFSAPNLVHIGNVIRNAITFNFRRVRETTVNTDVLLQTVDELFILLEKRQIEYVLVGGIAMLQHVEGRNTEDINLIMALDSLHSLPEIQITSQDNYFVRGQFKILQIDVLLTSNRLFDLVRREYITPHRFAEREIPCATVEGLLLLKLYALPSLYQQGDFVRVSLYENDIAALLYTYSPSLDSLYTILCDYLAESDLIEVHSIVAEIEQRIARVRRRSEASEGK